MATTAPPPVQISEAEYLESSFSPDCDYVDGELKERNVGDEAHSDFQGYLPSYLHEQRSRLGFRVRPDYRLKVAPNRYRVPDIQLILRSVPHQPVLAQPPLAIIEVLSPKDTLDDVQERCQDYLAMGVPHVWIVNPRRRRAWAVDATGLHEVAVLRTQNPEIVIDLAAVFAGIDEEYE